jgi:hypothetical protein
MELQLPAALSIAFLLTTLATVIFFHRAVTAASDPVVQRLAWPVTIAALIWLTVQGVVSIGIYVISADLCFRLNQVSGCKPFPERECMGCFAIVANVDDSAHGFFHGREVPRLYIP